MLSAKIVKNIIDKHRTNSPTLSTMNVEDFAHNLTIFFNMRNSQSSKKNLNYYTIGNFCRRPDNENKFCKAITF
jgi:hypothetical protein